MFGLVSGLFLLGAAELTPACPRQPEPRPLTSAAFQVPSRGDTILFATAPSFLRTRYAVRIVRRENSERAHVTVLRLERRPDCNVHIVDRKWISRLSKWDTDQVLAEARAMDTVIRENEVVLDGTHIQLQRYENGQVQLDRRSNGRSTSRIATYMLQLLRKYVPVSELPASAEWRFRKPGSEL